MILRDYQLKIIEQIYKEWDAGVRNVLVQLPTGAGKTIVFTHVMKQHMGASIAIAHRVELVCQISLALARLGVSHNIIAQPKSIKDIITIHIQEFGQSYYRHDAKCHVAAVDTLLKQRQLPRNISLVVQDEAHHVLRDNKWGKVAEMFPCARGLYPTATPLRADGRGLGRHADGVIDAMIVGVPMRELINQGHLTDYRIFAPPCDLDLSSIEISKGGDYSLPSLRAAVHKSRITGDAVEHYLRIAPGKLGITFAVDIEAARELAAAYNQAGVSAEIITGKTPDLERARIMRRFRRGEILQLVNVDILGEGVDVPAVSVVSMCRATLSYSLYCQSFGRALRPSAGKDKAIIIDHVNNVLTHGLPDRERVWSLDRSDKRSRVKACEYLRTCLSCFNVYEILTRVCPYCATYTPPAARNTPAQVSGDLLELDADTLATLRGERDRIDSAPRIPQGVTDVAKLSIAKKHRERQIAQRKLRHSIAIWAGYLHRRGISDSEIYLQFYSTHKVDIMTAQTLSTKDAEDLRIRIDASINKG